MRNMILWLCCIAVILTFTTCGPDIQTKELIAPAHFSTGRPNNYCKQGDRGHLIRFEYYIDEKNGDQKLHGEYRAIFKDGSLKTIREFRDHRNFGN